MSSSVRKQNVLSNHSVVAYIMLRIGNRNVALFNPRKLQNCSTYINIIYTHTGPSVIRRRRQKWLNTGIVSI